MNSHIETGKYGEKIGKAYLEEQGYKIITCNWRYKNWEIDVIATKGDLLRFVEIKTRLSDKFGYPEDDVTKIKLRHLIDAAEEYCIQNAYDKYISFDILAITLHRDMPPEFFLIEDVYL